MPLLEERVPTIYLRLQDVVVCLRNDLKREVKATRTNNSTGSSGRLENYNPVLGDIEYR